MALVDHVGDVGCRLRFPLEHSNLVKDSENLIGVDGAERQIVIGVPPIVEMESAHHFLLKEPRNDLLDVLSLVVMTGIDQHHGLGPGLLCKEKCHTPIGDVRMIEGGLEWFVFEKQSLAGFQRAVNFSKGFLKIADSLANILSARIVGTIGEPGGDVSGAKGAGDCDAFEYVSESHPAN